MYPETLEDAIDEIHELKQRIDRLEDMFKESRQMASDRINELDRRTIGLVVLGGSR